MNCEIHSDVSGRICALRETSTESIARQSDEGHENEKTVEHYACRHVSRVSSC